MIDANLNRKYKLNSIIIICNSEINKKVFQILLMIK